MYLCYQTNGRMQVSSTIWFHFQAGQCICSCGKVAQDWVATNCSEFMSKDEWRPNLLHVNPLDYHVWGVMLEHYKTFYPKLQNSDGLKKILQLIRNQLPQDSINKAILSFTKTLSLQERWDGHLESALRKTV